MRFLDLPTLGELGLWLVSHGIERRGRRGRRSTYITHAKGEFIVQLLEGDKVYTGIGPLGIALQHALEEYTLATSDRPPAAQWLLNPFDR